jgi:cell division protein FtsZ
MALKINMVTPQQMSRTPKITVIGVGGGGGNAVANMIASKLNGATFVAANTDLQALDRSPADVKIRLGNTITEGLGAGANPEVGAAAAEESYDEITEALRGSHMVFVTAGMGGGTGTGAAPVVARAAKEQGILTVAVVTKPFSFEGTRRMKIAEAGVEELQQYADTVIVIPNQNLFRLATERTTLQEAFKMADEVLYKGVHGVTDLFLTPGLVNVDFNDIKTVMSEMGQAMMGTGEAEGERRAILAAEMAISSPLLDGISMAGARGVLINITGGNDMTLYEADEASNRIREEVDPEANIIWGTAIVPEMTGKIRVSVVATGIGGSSGKKKPYNDSSFSSSSSFSLNSRPATRTETTKAQAVETPVAKAAPAKQKDDTKVEALFTAPQREEKPARGKAAQVEADNTPDLDDLEIPAFLRRQVN